MKRIVEHLKDNSGDSNVSKMIWVAVIFVVGAILLILLTSSFQGPIKNWFTNTVHSWFKSDPINTNGGYPNIEVTTPSGNGGSGGTGFFGDLG